MMRTSDFPEGTLATLHLRPVLRRFPLPLPLLFQLRRPRPSHPHRASLFSYLTDCMIDRFNVRTTGQCDRVAQFGSQGCRRLPLWREPSNRPAGEGQGLGWTRAMTRRGRSATSRPAPRSSVRRAASHQVEVLDAPVSERRGKAAAFTLLEGCSSGRPGE